MEKVTGGISNQMSLNSSYAAICPVTEVSNRYVCYLVSMKRPTLLVFDPIAASLIKPRPYLDDIDESISKIRPISLRDLRQLLQLAGPRISLLSLFAPQSAGSLGIFNGSETSPNQV